MTAGTSYQPWYWSSREWMLEEGMFPEIKTGAFQLRAGFRKFRLQFRATIRSLRKNGKSAIRGIDEQMIT